VCSEDVILAGQILDLQQQLLVYQPPDVCHKPSPLTTFHPR
jgi:hypothetical protein